MSDNNLWASLVPPAKQEAVARALRRAFGTTDVTDVTPLTGGGSNSAVLKIVVEEKPYVLRIIGQVHALNDPVRQFACLKTAGDAGISPRVHYADPTDGVSVTDFIAPVSLREYSGSLLVGLAEMIKGIQATPRFPALFPYLDGIDGFIQQFHALELLPEQATREHFDYYAKIQEAYPRHDPDQVSSHNDLNPGNILFDGTRLWVIDWETAFSNDRYADLANVANFFFRDEPADGEPGAEEETLLGAFFGDTPSEYQRARFFLMRQAGHMCYAMLLMILAASRRTPGAAPWSEGMETPRLRDFHRQRFVANAAEESPLASAEGLFLYGKVRLNEALHNMKTPRFREAIRKIRG